MKDWTIWAVMLMMGLLFFMLISMMWPMRLQAGQYFQFPACSITGTGDKAHYTEGYHQIVSGGLLYGRDDVYTLDGGNYLQCFCPPEGEGTQTNWLRTTDIPEGWYAENGEQWGLGDYQYAAQNVPFSCTARPTPTPIISVTPTESPVVTPTPDTVKEAGQSGTVNTAQAPVCPDGSTTKLPANVHVLRAGEMATVNAFLTEGDSANVYWSVVGEPHWQYSSAQTDPGGVRPNAEGFISYEVHGLDPNLGYDFGVQQKTGCGGGQITGVVVDGPAVQVFPLNYYEE